MRRLSLPFVLLSLIAGCQCLPPLRSDNIMRIPDGVSGKVQMEIPGQIDKGPLLEIPIDDADSPLSACAAHKIAVIDVDGILCNTDYVGPYSQGENPLAVFKEKLAVAAADPNVRAVVLRFNSPGGSVATIDMMLHEILAFKKQTGKPIVSCFLDLGTGGTYYLACGTDAIVATPGTIVGGFGVVLNLYNATVAMELQNVFDATIREGAKVDMGSPVRKLTDDEKTLLKSMAQEYHERFKTVVVAARKNVKRDADFFDGRIMTAHSAKQAGLIDHEGYLGDAIAMARQLANVDKARVLMYRRKGDPAYSLYASTANRPIHGTLMPYSIPGLDRSRLPLFLYMWQADPTMLKMTGQ
jgi:protease-4